MYDIHCMYDTVQWKRFEGENFAKPSYLSLYCRNILFSPMRAGGKLAETFFLLMKISCCTVFHINFAWHVVGADGLGAS